MVDSVDVLAYDEPAGNARSGMTTGVVIVGAVTVGYGVLRGQVLLGVLVAALVLGVRAVVVSGGSPEVRTRYRTIEAGRGEEVVAAHEAEARRRDRLRTATLGLVALVVLGYGLLQGTLLLAALAAGMVGGVGVLQESNALVPRLVEERIRRDRAEELYELTDASSET